MLNLINGGNADTLTGSRSGQGSRSGKPSPSQAPGRLRRKFRMHLRCRLAADNTTMATIGPAMAVALAQQVPTPEAAAFVQMVILDGMSHSSDAFRAWSTHAKASDTGSADEPDRRPAVSTDGRSAPGREAA